MSQFTNHRRKPAGAVLILALVSLVLAACGGSSSSKTSTTATAAAARAAAAGNPDQGATAGRFDALRECLAKNGITLPKRTPGQTRPPSGLLGGVGGARHLPAGVSRAKYQAAVQKCGGFPVGAPRGGTQLSSTAFKQGLAKFASCMHANGVNVPAPDTSGKGPIFKTNGLNTNSSQFRAAMAKCSTALGLLRRGSGAGTPPAGAGAAPAG
jgi:hypothetical protein